MNNWQAIGTILAGVAAVVTAGVGLYEQLKTVQRESYKPIVIEQKVDIKREFGVISDPDGWVYIREAPTVSSNVLAKLLNDSHVEIIGQQGNWYKIHTDSGREGYIYKDRIVIVNSEYE